jgi:hypothetical protein
MTAIEIIKAGRRHFSDEQADFVLIDVPSCKGWGYSAETLRGPKEVIGEPSC